MRPPRIEQRASHDEKIMRVNAEPPKKSENPTRPEKNGGKEVDNMGALQNFMA